MPKMSDVAKKAGVALSTVSYAISGTRPISDETRQRIFAAMDELGFKPNALARGLASKRSHIIALLFPAIERGLGFTEMEFVTNATEAARSLGYNLVLWSSAMDTLALRALIQQELVDGVVVMEVSRHDKRVQLLREIGIPFSLIGRCDENEGINYTDIDFHKTVYDAIEYLSGLGHEKIALLNQSKQAFDEGYGPVWRTQKSFDLTIKEFGLKGVSRFCPTNPLAGYEIMTDLLKRCPDMTALIAMNERAIPGIFQAVSDRGWRIPDDFSLIVIVSSERIAEMVIPNLTTSDTPSSEMGRLGVQSLIQMLENKNSEVQQVLLPCNLVVRGSTGPKPLPDA
ncbi:MAG: LacI family DNA-binding transcriptional regulator [Anaerolineaceae bacterium]|nr:LacI family DNA-binding transcriptional regulator [Anaerolineaceae bacterium]